MFIKYFLSIFSATLICLIITPLVRWFFISRGWVEDPLIKHRQTGNATALSPVPRGGGIPIFLAVSITSSLFLPSDKHLLGIILASLLTLVVGVWDDLKDISPQLRLVTNIFAAGIVVSAGIGVAYISNPFNQTIIDLSLFRWDFIFLGNHSLWYLADILAIFWIVLCMNIVGWSAGVEGQLPGFVAISAIFIGILGIKFSQDIQQWPVIILAGAVAGAYLGFLPYNFFPQSIMPGYSAKSLAGFFLGVLAILSGAKLATTILLLGVPLIDAGFVILKRLASHRSPLAGGPDHLHHTLLKLGWSRPSISVLYWTLSLVLGTVSLFLNSQQKLYVFLGLILVFFSFTIKVSRHT